MNGAGNDFVVLDNRFYAFTPDELSALARRLSPRRTSIGADGLLALAPPDDPAHDFRMLYFNADGSRATMCGNGARCLARYARGAGFDRERLTFETDAGLYHADVPADPAEGVCLYLPDPRDFRRHDVDGEAAWWVWTGTEHLVVFRPDVADTGALHADALRYRHHESLAPNGANVNFAAVAADRTVRVQTFEKGVEDWTLACGTGAVAVALAALFTGRARALPIHIDMPGGRLTVGGRQTGAQTATDLTLTGPAEAPFRGSLEW